MAAALQGLGQDVSREFQAHVQSVRLFMRDFAELNLLVRGEESSDRMIAWATMDFLSDFNGTPPFTNLSIEDLARRNLQNLAVRGTCISLMQSVMILHARNHLPFTDGGLTIQINDKAPMLQSMIGMLQSAYEQNKRLVKTAINVEDMLDYAPSGLHSDYYTLHTLGLF